MPSFFDRLCNFSVTSEIEKSMMPAPNLHQEVIVMLSGALTIYIVADLRELARNNKATVPLEELEAPITMEKVLTVFKDNKESLKELGNDGIEERINALENLKVHNSIGFLGNLFGGNQAEVVEFVDINSTQELVHAITVNHTQKRITVIFRGSVTTKDFVTDAKVGQIKVDNPAHKLDKNASKETMRLHYGFHEYLFKNNCPINEGKTRYEGILLSLKKLLKENKGYKVECTGHSLGAALCTLFGFYVAADDEIFNLSKGPVRVVSVASPYVGNVKFLMAFQALERLGRLMHLRVANAEDLVSLMPIAAPKLGLNVSDLKNGIADMYRHCGIKLHLNDLSKKDKQPIYKLTYPQCQKSDESIANELGILFEDSKNFIASIKKVLKKAEQSDVLRYHSCDEYELRLNACKGDLEKLTLEGLYQDKSIVGDTLNPGYVPKLLAGGETLNKISFTGGSLLKTTIRDMVTSKKQ